MAAEGGRAGAALTGTLIGILIGAMLVLPFANSLRHRNAYPRGLMAVMENDLAQLRQAADESRCLEASAQDRLRRLLSLAQDSRAAFKAEQDERFGELDSALHTSLQRAIESPDCGTQVEALEQVDRQCEACHREYR
jgi:uncharacterized membrane protein YccC